jgi:hypothetical protein
VTALAAVAFMFAAQSLYEIRDGLRGQEAEDISMPEFVLGRLVGRLSSFPNSAMIIEQAPFFFVSVASYRDEFPLVQALGGIVSGSLIPDDRPEVLLYQLNNQNDTEGVSSFMAGVNGIVYFSAYKSVGALFLALFLYLFFIYSTLWIAYNTKCKYMLEVTFVSLVYLGVSGVLNEFGYLFVSVLIASIFIKVIGIVNFSPPTSRRA